MGIRHYHLTLAAAFACVSAAAYLILQPVPAILLGVGAGYQLGRAAHRPSSRSRAAASHPPDEALYAPSKRIVSFAFLGGALLMLVVAVWIVTS